MRCVRGAAEVSTVWRGMVIRTVHTRPDQCLKFRHHWTRSVYEMAIENNFSKGTVCIRKTLLDPWNPTQVKQFYRNIQSTHGGC